MRLLSRVLAIAALSVLATATASGQTWNGTTDSLWGNAANWSTTVPVAGSTATFNNAGNGNVNINLGGLANPIGTILFDTAAAAAYNFSGNAGDAFIFDAAGAVTVNATVTANQTFNAPLQFLGAFTSTNNGTGSLTFNGGFSLAAGGTAGLLTVTGTGATTIGGVIDATSVTGLTKTGTGTLTLTGQNLFTGVTTLSGGTLALSGGNDRLLPASTLAFNGTSTLALGATNQTFADITTPTNVAGTYTISGTGTLTVNGPLLQFGPGVAGNTPGTPNVLQTVTMTGLSAFVYNNSTGTVRIGLKNGAGNSVALGQLATVNLAESNTITATNFIISGVGANSDGGIASVNLGTTNVLNVTTFNLASTRADGNMQFQVGLTNPSLTIRGVTGGTSFASTLNMNSTNQPNSGQQSFASLLNTTGGIIDANITTINMSLVNITNGTNRSGDSNSTITLGAGVLNVVNLNMGRLQNTTGTVGTNGLRSFSTLNLNDPATIVNATTITLADNLITATANPRQISAIINLNDGLLRSTTILRGANTGTASITAARINWANGTIENTAGSNLNIVDIGIFMTAGTHTFNATGTNSIIIGTPSVISGAGFAVTKTGPGTLVYNATNTYTGGTIINAGTVQLNAGGTLGGATSPLTFGGGTLNLNGQNASVGTLSGTSGSILNDAAATTSLLTATSNANSTYSGSILNGNGTTAFTKAGSGTLTLGGALAYSGTTTIEAGTLQFSNLPSSTSGLDLRAGGNLVMNTGVGVDRSTLPSLSLVTGTGNSQMTLQLDTPTTSDRFGTTGAAVTGTSANNLVLNFTALTGFGTGLYPIFNAASGLTAGGLNYNLGTLPPGFAYNLIKTDSLISLDVFTVIPSTGPIYWTGATSTRWNDTTLGNAVNFTTNLAGTTIMTGSPNPANTVIYSATNVNALNTAVTTLETNFAINDLVFNNETASGLVTAITIAPGIVPTSTLTIAPALSSAGINVQTGAPATITISAPLAVSTANQTWTVADALTSLTASGGLTGSANITTAGLGAIFLNNAGIAYTGNITVNNSVLSFGGTVATTINGTISGTGAVLKADAGTVVFGANNSYTGGTAINGGRLDILSLENGSVNSGIGASTNAANNLIFSGGSTLTVSALTNTTDRNITMTGDGRIAAITAGASIVFNGSFTGAGTLAIGLNATTISSTSVYTLNGDSSAGFTGGVTINNGAVTIKNANALGAGAKTIRVQVNSTGLASLILDGTGGNVILPADFSFITSASAATSGIFSIAGNNSILGNFQFDSGNGATNFFVSAGSTLTLGGNGTILTGITGRAAVFGGAGTGFANGTYTDGTAGALIITKNADPGTWTFGGTGSTYTGNTIVLGGTLRAGANNAFSAASRLFFGDASANIGTFDTNGFDVTFNGLSAQSNNVLGSTLIITAGNTLNITGSTVANVVHIGGIGGTSVVETRLNVTGSGTLSVNDSTRNFVVAQQNANNTAVSPAILDMTGLATFNATVNNIYVGRSTNAAGASTGTGSANESALLLLANTNTITANADIVVGGTAYSTGQVKSGTIRLGTNNTINANRWVVGSGRVFGTVVFQTGLTNPGVTLRGPTGGITRVPTIVLADGSNTQGTSGGGGSTDITGTMDFSAGTVDALIETLIIGGGGSTASNIRATSTGIFTMAGAASIVDVNTLVIGRANLDSSTSTNPGTSGNGTLNVNGGTFIVNNSAIVAQNLDSIAAGGVQNVVGTFNVAGGNATVGSTTSPIDLLLGNFTADSSGIATATLNVTAGTLTMNGNILRGSTGTGTGTITSTVNLNGGSLNLNGRTIGSATNPITNVTLVTGTLSNVLEINGGATGVTKNTAGTLTLAGTNSYTGPTTVSNGTLLVTANNSAATGAILVDGGTTGGILRGTGTLGGAVTVNGGTVPGQIRAGASIGTLTLNNGLTVNAGGQIFVELAGTPLTAAPDTGLSTAGTLPNPTTNNFLNITGGLTTIDLGSVIVLDGTNATLAPSTSYSFKIGQGAGVQNFVITNAGQFQITGIAIEPTTISFTGNGSGDLFVNFTTAIPEPALALVLLAGLPLLRRRVR